MSEQIINEQEIREAEEEFEKAIAELALTERNILDIKSAIAKESIKMREQPGFTQGKNEEERAAQLRAYASDLHITLDTLHTYRITCQEWLDIGKSKLTMCDRLLKLMEILKG